ncbi:AraC family transcriptional regulator [Chelativorans sp. AA-79]|uniref:AraC family transcriptional regulator n=1 Tax=Chelativorans sp. AA-79 TaxID=3028735 RepID=UPI0023F6787A|nr:AraC family transcriptional regulator [Chelativorans sp. AA-79]WEX07996.1 AraC family transcriptional regulator [Chelativorans sp. AA-79]
MGVWTFYIQTSKKISCESIMADPLAQIIGLLHPGAPFSKCVTGSGPWRVRRTQSPNPYYVAVLKGSVRYWDHQSGEVIVNAGDFILIPSAQDFMMWSAVPSSDKDMVTDPVILPGGGYRVGSVDGPTDMRALVGYCIFQSEDAVLLSSLLPKLVVVRGEHRLAMLMQLLGEEAVGNKPGREVVLQHLLEVLLIEALRTTAEPGNSPGLLRGLSDERLAVAIRAMHAEPGRGWTVAELAREAAVSRSGFHDRFQSAVGMAPMEYLTAWRLTLAKDFLRKRELSVSVIARQVGYSSASAFSVAFARSVGVSPVRYAREAAAASAGRAAEEFEGAIA